MNGILMEKTTNKWEDGAYYGLKKDWLVLNISFLLICTCAHCFICESIFLLMTHQQSKREISRRMVQ